MELITLLTTAKEAGFETGSIVSLIIIYFMLRKFVSKQNEELKTVLNTQVDKIVSAINVHNHRLEILETDVKEIKKKIGE